MTAPQVNWAERQVRRVDRFQQRHTVLAFPWAVMQKFGNDQAGGKAALMAYYGLFALFPLLLLLATVLGFVLAGNPALRDQIINTAVGKIPVIGDQIRSEVHPLEGNTTALVIGIVGTIYGSLGIGFAAQNAMNTVWNIPFVRWPNIYKRYLRTFGAIALLGLGVLSSTALSAFATAIANGVAATVFGVAAALVVNLRAIGPPRRGGRRDLRLGVLADAAAHRHLVCGQIAGASQRHLRGLRDSHHPAVLAVPGLPAHAAGRGDQRGAAVPAVAPLGHPAPADQGRPAHVRPARPDGGPPAGVRGHGVLHR
jgi:Virulence factor BrkB